MGRNARFRKDRKIIAQYGQLPPLPRQISWDRWLVSLLVISGLVTGSWYGLNKMKPKLAGLFHRTTTPSPTTSSTPSPSSSPANSPTVQPSPSTSPITQPSSSAMSQSKEQKNMIAIISTTMGDIKLELFTKDAPKTVENFQKLAAKGYYNGLIFHRVIKTFMIQGGDPTGTGRGGESIFGAKFEDEINAHKIVAGTLAMANAGPNTNGSQFFIVTEQPQPHLDGKHTVFGQVIAGMEVVKKIAAVEVDANDKPKQDIKMTNVKVEEKP